MAKTAEYTGRVLSGGMLELPAAVRHNLQLHPNMQVKVTLSCTDQRDETRLAEERAKVWRQVDELREILSQKDFNLTDALLQARQEEDDAL